MCPLSPSLRPFKLIRSVELHPWLEVVMADAPPRPSLTSAPATSGVSSKRCICFKLKNPEARCGWDCNKDAVRIPISASPEQRLRLVRSLVGLNTYDTTTMKDLCSDAIIKNQRISIHHFSNEQLKIGKGGHMCLKPDAVADRPVVEMRNINADSHMSTHALPPTPEYCTPAHATRQPSGVAF